MYSIIYVYYNMISFISIDITSFIYECITCLYNCVFVVYRLYYNMCCL